MIAQQAPAPVEIGSHHAPLLDADEVAAHLDREDAEDDDDEDDAEDVDLESLDLDEEEDEDGDDLEPLPPPGPATGEGVSAPDAPTVLAKRGRKPSRTGKPKAVGAGKKKKAVARKKPRPSK
jgi:hypothetical protein